MKTKTGILILVITIVVFILMQGTERGTFYKTSDNTNNLWIVLSLLLVIIAFASGIYRKYFYTTGTWLQKAKPVLFLLVICLFPAYILTGLVGYVDYYTTNKQWKTIEVSVANKIDHISNRSSYYSYKLVGKDTVLYLNSRMSFKDFETFYISICTTRLGNVVAYRNYPQKK